MRAARAQALLIAIAMCAIAPAQPDLAARDKALTRGSISYHITIDNEQEDIKLAYSASGKALTQYKETAPTTSRYTTTIVQGRPWMYVHVQGPGKDSVDFRNFAGAVDVYIPDNDKNIRHGPCFALGGGFSKGIFDKKTLADGSLQIQSHLMGGSIIVATYKTQKDKGVPDRIEYRGKTGQTFNTWTFTGAIPAGGGTYLPKQSQLYYGKRLVSRITIDKADFSSEPKESDLVTDWFHPGVSIIDDRFTPGVNWTYDSLLAANGGKADITAEKLRDLSRAINARVNKVRNPVTLTQEEQFQVTYHRFLWIVFGVCALALILFLLVRRKLA